MFAMVLVIIAFVIRHQRKMLLHKMQLKIIENEKQVALIKASLEAEERQKNIIANNLHDSIKPMLTHLKYSLTAHQSALLDNKFNFKDLDKDRVAIDRIIDEIRDTCHDLIPSVLNLHGLYKAMEEFIEGFNLAGVVKATFVAEPDDARYELIPKNDQVNIYRVCQELLNNILKHSGCNELIMTVFFEDQQFCVHLSYNGKGITDQDIEGLSKTGLGLNSLKTRALILNASLNYLQQGKDYLIKFHVPISYGRKN